MATRMKSDIRSLRGVAAQVLMGGAMGALFAGVILLANLWRIDALIAETQFPLATLIIFCAGSVLYFAFGAGITGFLLLVSDGFPDERDPAS
jgi:hypothetical protein